jgi:hypothetical protein
MCYASAEGRSRDAREDEVLVVQRQPHGSNWLVSPDDRSTAVCLRDGTEVELLYIPEKTQKRFGLPQEAKAIFKMEDWWQRDVFVLENDRKLPLKKLRPGQVLRVLSGQAASDRKEIPLEEQRTDGMVEGGSMRRHIFKGYPSSVPVHWCL